MTFTSDEERREIAENLRREILYARGSLGDWWMRLHEAVTGSEDFPCPQETMAAIADLIDRPTCRLDLTDVETHGNTKVRIYECSECGRTCEEIYGKYERCPHCGAVVVDED